MASLFCCLRRSLNLSSSSLTRMSRAVVSCSSVVLQQPQAVVAAAELPVSQNHLHQNNNYMKSQICWFRSSPVASAARYNNNNNDDDDKIGPDTILFEGCDYNHWLITMDFPKDPKPTPEEMVETYVQTLAKVVGSVEEAKKRMYACSTTTYQGFQAVMTEEMSEKFKGLPGVVFILPDSYIDPVNKEYGGDKYIDGVIIPRPPPVQYQKGGRFDRNRQQGPAQGDGRNYEARQNYGPGDGNNHGAQRNYPPQRTFSPNPTGQGDGRSFPAQQNYAPQQNYGPSPTGQGGPGNPMTGNRDYVPGGRGPMPSYQRELPQAGRSDYVPQDNRDFRGDNRNFSPSASGDYRQGAGSSYAQNYTGNGVGQRFPQMEQRDGLQGAGSSYDQNYTQNGAGQRFTQMEQRDGLQGAGSSYDQNYTGNGAGQRFPQMEQRDGLQGEQRAFSPMGQTRNNQGGY